MKSEEFEVLKYFSYTKQPDRRVNIAQVLYDLHFKDVYDDMGNFSWTNSHKKVLSVILRLKELSYLEVFNPASKAFEELEKDLAVKIESGYPHLSDLDIYYAITKKGEIAFLIDGAIREVKHPGSQPYSIPMNINDKLGIDICNRKHSIFHTISLKIFAFVAGW